MSVEPASGCGWKGELTQGFGKIYYSQGVRASRDLFLQGRDGRRIYIWQVISAKADTLAKIIVKYQVPWKQLLIPGAGSPMEPEARSGSD